MPLVSKRRLVHAWAGCVDFPGAPPVLYGRAQSECEEWARRREGSGRHGLGFQSAALISAFLRREALEPVLSPALKPGRCPAKAAKWEMPHVE